MVSCETRRNASSGKARLRPMAIGRGDQSHRSLTATQRLQPRSLRQQALLRSPSSFPGLCVGLRGPIHPLTSIALNLPADRRRRPAQPLGELAYRGARRETARDLLAIQRLKASSRAAACPGSKAPFTPDDLQNRARPPVEASRYLDQGPAFLPAFPQSGLLRRGKPSSHAHAPPPPTIESEGVASTGLHHPDPSFLRG